MKQLNHSDFSHSLTALYVTRFEHGFLRGSRLSVRLRQLLEAYEHRVSSPRSYGLAETEATVKLAAALLEDLLQDFPGLMLGWVPGAGAANEAQSLANLLNEIVLELSQPIVRRASSDARSYFGQRAVLQSI